ncbi:MAG: molybdenum cofactor guanylyltransferase [Anaerolineae bacterium]
MFGQSKPNLPVSVSAIVLAGGRSSRFGRDKSLLLLKGEPLLVQIINKLVTLSNDLIVVTNQPERYGFLSLPARLLPDERPGEGSLMGIYSGLKAARHFHALVVACDMPFLNLSLLHHMISLAEGHDVVIPRVNGLLEPLHAIYSKACLPAMGRLLEQGQRQIIAFFHEVRVCYVEEEVVDRFDPEHLSLININTRQDWDRVQQVLRSDTEAERSQGHG